MAAAANLGRVAARLRNIPAEALPDVARRVTAIAEAEGGRVKGYQLTATSRLFGDTVIIRGKPAGFWVWVNTGTKPHAIRPRRKDALYGKYGHPARKVAHPGSKGRGAWKKVVRRAQREAPRIVERHVHEAVT